MVLEYIQPDSNSAVWTSKGFWLAVVSSLVAPGSGRSTPARMRKNVRLSNCFRWLKWILLCSSDGFKGNPSLLDMFSTSSWGPPVCRRLVYREAKRGTGVYSGWAKSALHQLEWMTAHEI